MGIDADGFEFCGVDPSLAHPGDIYTIAVFLFAYMEAVLFLNRLKSDPIGVAALMFKLAFHSKGVGGQIHGAQREQVVRDTVARILVID